MPELPEVDRIVKQLDQELVTDLASIADGAPSFGISVQFFHPALLKGCTGTSITQSISVSTPTTVLGPNKLGLLQSVTRKGKYIVFDFDKPATIILHLGMTGQLIIEPAIHSDKRFTKYLSARFFFERTGFSFGCTVAQTFDPGPKTIYLNDKRKFARCYIARGESAVEKLKAHIFKSIGPDIIEISESDFVNRYQQACNKRPTTLLKRLLLDQSIVSGIGNIYACETLWALGVHPLTSISFLDGSSVDIAAVYQAARSSIFTGISQGGSSVQDYFDLYGQPGSMQDHLKVYGRKDKACKRPALWAFRKPCKGFIERIAVEKRGTFFCPVCQQDGKPPFPPPLKSVAPASAAFIKKKRIWEKESLARVKGMKFK